MPPRGGMLASKLVLIITCAFIGAVALFFGGSLVVIGLAQVGVLKRFISFDSWMVISTVAGAIIGGFIGYLIFKRSRLSDKEYYKPF